MLTPQPEGVEGALPTDAEDIFNLLMMAHDENGVRNVDAASVKRTIAKALNREGLLIGVIRGKHGLEGVIMMALSQWWYTDEWHLEELVTFVHPDHRETSHAKKLLQFAKWSAETMKIPLFIGVVSSDRVEAKVRLYKRQFAYAGAFFHHNLYGSVTGVNGNG